MVASRWTRPGVHILSVFRSIANSTPTPIGRFSSITFASSCVPTIQRNCSSRAVFSEAREMARGKSEYLNEIFRLLSEQQGLLEHLPYSSEQVRKEKRILVRIHRLVDQIICSEQSTASGARLAALSSENQPVT